MILPPSFSRKKMGENEIVEAEKMGWIDLPVAHLTPLSPASVQIAFLRRYKSFKCFHKKNTNFIFLTFILCDIGVARKGEDER